MFLGAVIQLNSTSDEEANWAMLEELVRRAAGYGATFVCTPENSNFLGPHAEKVWRAEVVGGPTSTRFTQLASDLGIHLLVGSVNEASEDENRCFNTSLLFGPDGVVMARYRKIHLFDVDVSDDVRFLESDTIQPGDAPTVTPTMLGTIGLSVCYDLRFPELYRHLVDHGATILTVPAAFTLTTGKDHWQPLLRARAIETQCYVFAPGQHGEHDDGGLRQSYGHSMIVDPWGHVIAMCSDGPGIALAEIHPERVQQVRAGMPISSHRRL